MTWLQRSQLYSEKAREGWRQTAIICRPGCGISTRGLVSYSQATKSQTQLSTHACAHTHVQKGTRFSRSPSRVLRWGPGIKRNPSNQHVKQTRKITNMCFWMPHITFFVILTKLRNQHSLSHLGALALLFSATVQVNTDLVTRTHSPKQVLSGQSRLLLGSQWATILVGNGEELL